MSVDDWGEVWAGEREGCRGGRVVKEVAWLVGAEGEAKVEGSGEVEWGWRRT
jgi:hypothetical protein